MTTPTTPMTRTSTPAVATLSSTPPRDARRYWRILLAVLAPCGAALIGLTNWLTPVPLTGTVAQAVAEVTAHRGLIEEALLVPQLLFPLTFVPGAVALVVALRRPRPVLAAVLGSWMGIAGLSPRQTRLRPPRRGRPGRTSLDPSRISEYVEPRVRRSVDNAVPDPVPALRHPRADHRGRAVLASGPGAALAGGADDGEPVRESSRRCTWATSSPPVVDHDDGSAMTYVSVVLLRMSDDDFDLRPLS